MWLSSELSSSPDEPPRVKVAPFFFNGSGLRTLSFLYCGEVFSIGVGCEASCVCERYDDILLGLKPLTISCVLISVAELSEEIILPEGFDALLPRVEADESRACDATARLFDDLATLSGCDSFTGGNDLTVGGVGDDGLSLFNMKAGSESEGKGSRFFFSCIEMTIFSRSIGVMCFSRPLLRCSVESLLRNPGRTTGEGGGKASSMSDSLEETLLDNAGTGMCCLARGDKLHLPASGERGCWVSGEQQNVSRFHNLQLRFSSRLPSSIASEILENTEEMDTLV